MANINMSGQMTLVDLMTVSIPLSPVNYTLDQLNAMIVRDMQQIAKIQTALSNWQTQLANDRALADAAVAAGAQTSAQVAASAAAQPAAQ